MKKVWSLLLVCGLTFLLTGCVKFNANMDIKKDKSMDFSIIYAFDTSVFGEQEMLKDEDKKNLEKQGFTVKDYSQNTMKGFSISRNVKNIDFISSDKSTKYDLSGLLENKSKNNYIFEVKKGLLKNTYKAKLEFDASDSDLNNSTGSGTLNDSLGETDDDSFDIDDDDDFDVEDDDATIDDDTDSTVGSNSMNDLDLSKMNANMDLSFNVKLPYPAKSSNATTKNNDGKELAWNLSSNNGENIEFGFELYNMTNIYIGVGIIVLLIIALVIFIIKKGKNKKVTNNTDLPNDSQNINGQEVSDLNVQTENVNNVASVPTQEVVQDSTLNSAESVQNESANQQVISNPSEPVQNEIINQQPTSNVQEQSTQSLNDLNQNNNQINN
ncbi:MAG: hypothetical protein IKE63_04275 [Bacilli bacterium]|nr:hypothetical protein [Bacilli bacterium]